LPLTTNHGCEQVARLAAHKDYSFAAAWHPDGNMLATGGEGSGLVPIHTGRWIWNQILSNRHLYKLRFLRASQSRATIKLLSDSGFDILFPGNQDTTSAVWDMRNLSSPLARLVGHMGAVRSLRFSPDGRFLAMAEPADFVHIFDVNSGFREVRRATVAR